jgi:hypothetical protein
MDLEWLVTDGVISLDRTKTDLYRSTIDWAIHIVQKGTISRRQKSRVV